MVFISHFECLVEIKPSLRHLIIIYSDYMIYLINCNSTWQMKTDYFVKRGEFCTSVRSLSRFDFQESSSWPSTDHTQVIQSAVLLDVSTKHSRIAAVFGVTPHRC
ncbi:unnamed protein product [Chrysodeixis includens]|uniref:Uncharacterized protein n=1 Tax=Chrysodeixis includens TaxID=689277 RepID=A0A9N8L2X7_CHRIL|nr:unnamed protein product [Chrysodeixis includens]